VLVAPPVVLEAAPPSEEPPGPCATPVPGLGGGAAAAAAPDVAPAALGGGAGLRGLSSPLLLASEVRPRPCLWSSAPPGPLLPAPGAAVAVRAGAPKGDGEGEEVGDGEKGLMPAPAVGPRGGTRGLSRLSSLYVSSRMRAPRDLGAVLTGGGPLRAPALAAGTPSLLVTCR
jgi:hypothetical protein